MPTIDMHRADIYAEIEAERLRQNELHPSTYNLPDGTGGGGRETWRTIATNSCDRAVRENRATFAHILDEEASEVLAETDQIKLREELVQLGAVCVRWIEKLDREWPLAQRSDLPDHERQISADSLAQLRNAVADAKRTTTVRREPKTVT